MPERARAQFVVLPARNAVREPGSESPICRDALGQHYARTLAEWRNRFQAVTGQASQLGFGPAFQRMWNLYLAYSEAGFRAGYLDVHQLTLERGW